MGGACVYLAPPFSTLVDFFHGKLVGRFLERGNRKAARMTVASSAFINLALLVIFKYTDFFIRSVNSLTGSGIPLLGLALPIGISFYTFQTMSYTIDVYRGEAPVQNNIISFGAYVSMFPQLIAGPIVRYQDIAAELNTRTESLERFSLGIRRFVVGLGKKVLLANQAGALWTEITGHPSCGPQRPYGMDGDPGLCLPNLFRLFRLFRYGRGHGPHAGLSFSGKL